MCLIFRVFLREITRPAGRVTWSAKCSRVESGSVHNIPGRVGSGRVGSGQEVFKCRRSGPAGSRVFQTSRFGFGRVGSRGDKKLTGRFRS